MKYDPSKDYIFTADLVCSGLNAKAIEEEFCKAVKTLIESKSVKSAFVSNDVKSQSTRKAYNIGTIQELSQLKDMNLYHIGLVNSAMVDSIKEQMNDKGELTQKRMSELENCIILYFRKDESQCKAVVIDPKHIYSISNM